MKKINSQLEVKLREYIIKFEKEYLGKGPEDVQIYVLDDMVLFRLKGILTRAETHLAKTNEGKLLVKETRTKLIESLWPIIKKDIEKIIGIKAQSLYSDISTKTGERIIIIVFERNLTDS